jgi:hypothetical protein
MIRFLLATVLACAATFAIGEPARVVELTTRPGVTQRVLVVTPVTRCSRPLTPVWRNMGDDVSRLDHNEPVRNRTKPGDAQDAMPGTRVLRR